MKIELKKLNALQHAVLPFSEVIDLKDEKMYGRNPFQSPVYVEGEVSNESGVLRLKGSIRTVYSTECARCLKPLDIPLEAEADMILSDDPEAEEEDDLFRADRRQRGSCGRTCAGIDPAGTDDLSVQRGLQRPRPHCGADRNVTECDCESRQIDPRFAALRALLDNDKGN